MMNLVLMKAVIEDWKNGLISTDQLFEVWGLPFNRIYRALYYKNPDKITFEQVEDILNKELNNLRQERPK